MDRHVCAVIFAKSCWVDEKHSLLPECRVILPEINAWIERNRLVFWIITKGVDIVWVIPDPIVCYQADSVSRSWKQRTKNRPINAFIFGSSFCYTGSYELCWNVSNVGWLQLRGTTVKTRRSGISIMKVNSVNLFNKWTTWSLSSASLEEEGVRHLLQGAVNSKDLSFCIAACFLIDTLSPHFYWTKFQWRSSHTSLASMYLNL